MSPGLLLVLLVALLLALLPVWRLFRAGWRPGILFGAWVVYAVAILLVLRVPGPSRFLVPILVLAYVAPFVAGPERLTRVLGPRAPKPRPIIDVTPVSRLPLPGPPDGVTPGADPDEDPDGGES